MATITVTKGYNEPTGFTSGETITPAKLNSAQTPTVGISAIQTADISDAQITTAKIADGNVTLAKLVAAVQQSLCPVGTVIASAANSVPSGWLWCDGSEKAIATYGDLYAAIGTTYGALTNGSGAAGSTHFRVPDLRGRFVRGWDGGTLSAGFGQYQADGVGNHVHSYFWLLGSSVNVASGSAATVQGNNISGVSSATFAASNTSNNTGGLAETRVKNLAMLFLIKT